MTELVVLDGGFSTQLQNYGVELSGALWTGAALMDTPDLVGRTHLDFVEAGAQIISTASYQVSRAGCEAVGLSASDADAALLASVSLAREATAGTSVMVAASVGPWGATLHDGSEYRGNYGVSQGFLEDFHRERLRVLAQASPDYWAVETIPELTEARALATVLAEFVEIPAWFSFSCGSSQTLASGEPIQEVLESVSSLPSVMAVGVNCVPPEWVETLVGTLASHTELPIIAYPNRGGRWDPATGQWSQAKGMTLVEGLPRWRDAGVSYLGGCCGHQASDIKDLTGVLAL
jgi:homocysteine S-methyltransferase